MYSRIYFYEDFRIADLGIFGVGNMEGGGNVRVPNKSGCCLFHKKFPPGRGVAYLGRQSTNTQNMLYTPNNNVIML